MQTASGFYAFNSSRSGSWELGQLLVFLAFLLPFNGFLVFPLPLQFRLGFRVAFRFRNRSGALVFTGAYNSPAKDWSLRYPSPSHFYTFETIVSKLKSLALGLPSRL
jgi:hypothetical protein